MAVTQTSGARLARYELPGTRWYFASCYTCRWVGLDWKHKGEAKRDRDDHNTVHHNGGSKEAS